MPDLYVCADCFEDPGIRACVDDNLSANACSFCAASADEPIAADLDAVAEYINTCLYKEYDDAANCLPFESREGGYQGTTWDRHELLEHEVQLGLPRDDDGRLLDAIA